MWTDDKKCCDIFPQYLWTKNKDKYHFLERGEYKNGKRYEYLTKKEISNF